MTFHSIQRPKLPRSSNTLYNYADTRAENPLTFEELMEYYDWQITEELEIGFPCGDEEVDQGIAQSAKEMREAQQIALDIYHECEAASEDEDEINEQAATRMQDHQNEYVQGIGKALESGDWSIVAI